MASLQVGFNPGEEFTDHWWTEQFNKTAKGITVEQSKVLWIMCTCYLFMWSLCRDNHNLWLGLQELTIWAQKITNFCLCSIITYDYLYNHTKSSSLLQNLVGFLLQLMEMGYYILNGRYWLKYNLCNLCSHSQLLQVQSHLSLVFHYVWSYTKLIWHHGHSHTPPNMYVPSLFFDLTISQTIHASFIVQ